MRISLFIKINHPDQSNPKYYTQTRWKPLGKSLFHCQNIWSCHGSTGQFWLLESALTQRSQWALETEILQIALFSCINNDSYIDYIELNLMSEKNYWLLLIPVLTSRYALSGGSRHSHKEGGASHPHPEIRGMPRMPGVKKYFLGPFGLSLV